jgi:hypothetical protein
MMPTPCERLDVALRSVGAVDQGLTLVPFSAQLKHILWDRGACRGCLGGV